MTVASAPGKVILCGEHAVVYGQPAIALPLPNVRATAGVDDLPRGSGIVLHTPDLGARWSLTDDPAHPLAMLVRLTLNRIDRAAASHLEITLRSDIPIASGMGSGAALGAALVKAIAAHLGARLGPDEVSRLVFESERVYHGTPSGIDNTVVSYEQAIWFVRRSSAGDSPASLTIEPIAINRPLALVIGDTGVRAPTRITVGGVRERWQREPDRYEALFAEIGALVRRMRTDLALGQIDALGVALNRNQELLRQIGVSSPELERLISATRTAGALGAKLSGGGGGGIMLALVAPDRQDEVARALLDSGAARVVQTVVT